MVSTARNTFYSSINIYIEYFIGFALSILIARTLGPQDYGDYSYFVKICGIAIILTNAGVNTGVVKFIAEARAKDDKELVSFIGMYFRRIQFFKTMVITTIVISVFIMFPELFIQSDNHLFLAILGVVIFFKSAHMYRINVMKGSERFDLLAAVVIIVCPLNLIVIGVAYYNDFDLSLFIYIFGVVSIFYWLVAGFFLPKVWIQLKAYNVDYSDFKKRINHHVRVVSVSAIVTSLGVGHIEVLLLKPLVGSEAVSFYTIGATISAAALLLVPGVYSAVLLPIIARTLSMSREGAVKKVSESTRHLFLLSTLVAVPTALCGQDIVTVMYGQDYVSAGWILGAMALVGILNTSIGPISAYLMSADKQTLLLKLNVVFFFVTVGLTYYLVLILGLKGAVYAFTAIIVLKTATFALIAKNTFQIEFEYGKLLKASVAAAIAIVVCSYSLAGLSGLLAIGAGFGLFSILFISTFLLFGTLSSSEYQAIFDISKKRGKAVRLIALILIKPHLPEVKKF